MMIILIFWMSCFLLHEYNLIVPPLYLSVEMIVQLLNMKKEKKSVWLKTDDITTVYHHKDDRSCVINEKPISVSSRCVLKCKICNRVKTRHTHTHSCVSAFRVGFPPPLTTHTRNLSRDSRRPIRRCRVGIPCVWE